MTARAHLQLERFRLQSLHIECDTDWLARETILPDRMDDYVVVPKVTVFEPKDGDAEHCGEDEVLVALSLHCEPAHDDRVTRFSQVHIEVWGLFSLSPDTPLEHVEQLKFRNSVAILHGIARGQVMQATGTCVEGPFILPSLNYVASHDDNDERGPARPTCDEQGDGDASAGPGDTE